jgi:hypothetical protein
MYSEFPEADPELDVKDDSKVDQSCYIRVCLSTLTTFMTPNSILL